MLLKVLIVDDDAEVLRVMRDVMTPLGASVVTETSSARAEELVNRDKFEGIIIDLLMPGIDGVELTKRVRASKLNGKTPIIAISGSGENMQKANAAGANFFLAKPFDRRKLTGLLNITRGSMLEERRRFKRVKFSGEVSCQSGSNKLTGPGLDLSQGGVSFMGNTALQAGAKVELSFRVRGGTLVKVSGNVIRVDEYNRVSVQFTDLQAGDKQAIRDYVNAEPD